MKRLVLTARIDEAKNGIYVLKDTDCPSAFFSFKDCFKYACSILRRDIFDNKDNKKYSCVSEIILLINLKNKKYEYSVWKNKECDVYENLCKFFGIEEHIK